MSKKENVMRLTNDEVALIEYLRSLSVAESMYAVTALDNAVAEARETIKRFEEYGDVEVVSRYEDRIRVAKTIADMLNRVS